VYVCVCVSECVCMCSFHRGATRTDRFSAVCECAYVREGGCVCLYVCVNVCVYMCVCVYLCVAHHAPTAPALCASVCERA